MTVEIRELVIKATVRENQPTGNESSSTVTKAMSRSLIDSCVAEVLKILKREQER